MQKHTWCTPIGVPDIDYNGDYQSLKNYFTNTFELPRDVIIDINETGVPVYTIRDSVNCGINYNFGDGSPVLDGYVLCNRPVIIDLEVDSTSCMRSQVELALSNAAGAYQQYMDSVRREYREIYLSRCLSAQPKLTMSGDLYEYHYTLYYYDQAGNLIKTVPPAGVHLLTAEEIAGVKRDRPYTTPECYKVADTLNFDGGNINFGNLLASRNTYSFETWINANYLDGIGIFSDAVTVTAPEKFIDSTRTIPAFTGRKGINFYGSNRYLEIELGQQPWYFPDTLYQTQYFTTSQPVDQFIGPDKWAHLVVMKTGNAASPFAIYINGRAIQLNVTTRVDTLGGPPVAQGTSELVLGLAHMNEYDAPFYGGMKQFRFYNRPMVYKEIIANYTDSCFLPLDERGLEIWMPMNEGRGEVVTDRMGVRDYNLLPSADYFWWIHTHDPVYPQHGLATNYQYNSLQGVIAQNTPDGGASHFWYDRLGRLTATQSKEQLTPVNGGTGNRYTYTKYDPLNRIVELGEKSGAANTSLLESLDNIQLQDWLNSGTNAQITRSQYDEPLSGLTIYQENIRKRIASAILDENGDGVGEVATHYSYDVNGNVKTLWQEIKQLESIAPGQGMKRIDYDYDLVSGKVNKIIYQPGQKDQFLYRYLYDADNRLINAATSRDGLIWQQDATYSYYLHGPLARQELGENKLQGVDYAYTLQGWQKGINSTTLNVDQDMGKDSKPGTVFAPYGKDVISYTLGYYAADYHAIGKDSATGFRTTFDYPSMLGTGNSLYNGNISNASVALSKLNNSNAVGYTYGYDQLNRLVEMRQHNINSSWTPTEDYKESIGYDANGNILQYQRNGTTQNGKQLSMDNLTYAYQEGTNRLRHIKDQVDAAYYGEDIDSQDDDNYGYDNNGNLIKDKAADITKIDWTVYGKIKGITQSGLSLQYGYDANGNRIWKDVNGQKTFYIRDEQGRVLGLYRVVAGGISWEEQHLYGDSRLGMWQPGISMNASADPEKDSISFGRRLYELNSHLGNVLATINDKKTGVTSNNTTIDYYIAEVVTQNDYYPFGMLQPERKFTLGELYRYGFNGKENDNEIKGEGNQQDYGMRVYDPRIGRFLSVDPLTKDYPSWSPYPFAMNRPLDGIDLDGLEWQPVNNRGENVAPGATNIADYIWVGYKNIYTPILDSKRKVNWFDGLLGVFKVTRVAPEGTVASARRWVDDNTLRFYDSNIQTQTGSTEDRHVTEIDNASLNRIGALHADVQLKMKEMILAFNKETGLSWAVTQGYRTIEYQDALYAQGRTAPGNIVTQARGGQSAHNFGMGVDVAPFVNGRIDYDWWIRTIETGERLRVGKLGESILGGGDVWGGRWIKRKENNRKLTAEEILQRRNAGLGWDPSHFQKIFGLSFRSLRAAPRDEEGLPILNR
ncbi:MAG TPA: RHS repeat-associated core domain-containing protein [Chitinophaga sp.]|uniref:RHS repeat-associated core domain-containing protein n=1 Tax=Chitinophaga sp. TaxID=1869181 RepID=UPI002F943042